MGLGVFTCLFGSDCLNLIGAFFFPCFLITLAINLCLLFGVKFKLRKIERTIAVVYLFLFLLSLYPLLIVNGFGLFNFHSNAEQWDVIRIWISVLFTDYCVIWVAVHCALYLKNGHSRLLKDA